MCDGARRSRGEQGPENNDLMVSHLWCARERAATVIPPCEEAALRVAGALQVPGLVAELPYTLGIPGGMPTRGSLKPSSPSPEESSPWQSASPSNPGSP